MIKERAIVAFLERELGGKGDPESSYQWLKELHLQHAQVIVQGGKHYMTRYFLSEPFKAPQVFAHTLHASDSYPDHHDHPWDFSSLILEGSYIEHRHRSHKVYQPGDIVRLSGEDAHTLELRTPEVRTLVVAGTYRRSWGFDTVDGWVGHIKYLKERE